MFRASIITASLFCVAFATPFHWERIIGGQKAAEGQFPHQVSIRNNGVHICGGSIISDQWILTAAEGIFLVPIKSLSVKVGSTQLSSGGETYSVAEKIVNNEGSFLNIALIKINEKFTFNNNVQPIELSNEEIDAGVELIASGWGKTSVPGQNSENLQFVNLQSISVEECQSVVNMDETHICTLDEDKQHGICGGDYGGPLMNNGKLVGVTSYTVWCAHGYPDVFKRVTSYIDWINQTIN